MIKNRPADITPGQTIDFDAKGVTNFYQGTWEKVEGQHQVASIQAIVGTSTTSRRSNRNYQIILANGREIQVSHQAKLAVA